MTTKNPFKNNRNEILWNIINSLIAGSLVFLGSLTSGKVTWQGVGFAILAFLTAAVVKFKEYWDGEKKEYSTKLFKFL